MRITNISLAFNDEEWMLIQDSLGWYLGFVSPYDQERMTQMINLISEKLAE